MAQFSNFKGESEKYTVQDLYDIILALRAPDGCPWDRVQTHESLIKPMIEEAYEAVDAIKNDDTENMKEELGDVLLQVIFHSIIGAEEGRFTLDDISDRCTRKMIFRHPHVFGEEKAGNAAEALDNWENVKKKEHGDMTLYETLDSVPHSFPALLRGAKFAKKLRLAAAETPEMPESQIPEEKKELVKCGRELFEICKKLDSLGVNSEEALSTYLDFVLKEAKKQDSPDER